MNAVARRSGPIYYQIASVLLLLLCVGFGISGLWAIVRLAAPTLTLNEWTGREVESFDAFIENRYTEQNGKYYSNREPMRVRPDTVGVMPPTGLTRAAVEDRWHAEQKRTVNAERRGGMRQLLLSVIAIAIALPLYLWHHREVRRARELD